MAKKIVEVVSKDNKKVSVKCGVDQQNFVDGDVWRFPSDLYADIASISQIDVSDKTRFQNTLSVLLQAFNEKFNSDLKATDYDVKSGKFDRRNPQQVATTQATGQPAQATATADTSDALSVWINQQYKAGVSSQQMLEMLRSAGWKDENLKSYFKELQVPATPNVPLPPQ